MRAVHFVRSRQEERELAYWLSLVAYDRRDRSTSNYIYLVYLVLFFSIWTFSALTFFASGGALLLRFLDPDNLARAAIFLEVLLLAVWSIFTFWQALKRSPVSFSEPDETLICQMPVSRRSLVLRWVWMPWLKSAVPFWLAAVTLGFSVAETNMPGTMDLSRIVEYSGYGLRAWLAVIPIHLALFLFRWFVGVARLNGQSVRRWLAWLVMPLTVAFFAFLLIFTRDPSALPSGLWSGIAGRILQPLQAGFSQIGLAAGLLSTSLLALVTLAALFWISPSFSLNRAAQETNELEASETAAKYGFVGLVEEQRLKNRLGVNKKPSRLPALAGAGALLWKDVLQSVRSLRLQSILAWFSIVTAMLALPILPDLGSRALLIAFWVIQIARFSVARLRNDLACWVLIRQLPFSHTRFLFFDLVAVYALSVLASLAGLAVHAAFFQARVDPWAAFIPGVVAGIVSMAAFDVCRQSRDELLLAGIAPELSALGSLLGVAVAAAPMAISILVSGYAGVLLATAVSLGLGGLAFSIADQAYRTIHTE
ncbi:hypothetical protein LARV_00287 [Longilinea arvoryzae]|uniref:Uncharacterized protein n=1 Tax=Longilinea arvoryzae TaxID=360412 RepID=A0A0S7B6D0_9CHLR|nr:hypothetical protein [Longilinea arvoryzae]GAP12551.1 hypothetical protein LARV_00287 [Longilinea arvoryzae]